MGERLVTLAIHTDEKARILKEVLGNEGIGVTIDNVNIDKPEVSAGVRVRIKESDLPHALNLVENRHLFRNKAEEQRVDDGRKRILVPIDFSDYSMKACQIAFNMAYVLNAKVKILHVYFNPFYPSALPFSDVFTYQAKEEEAFQSVIEKVREDIKSICKKIDEKIADGEFPTINYSYVLREGLPEEEIISFSKEYNPAIIVMGTRGKSQKDIDLIGSVTAEVIEASHTPVIALPENTHFSNFNQVKNLAFFTNFSQRDLLAFESMISVLKFYKPKIFLTHISNKRDTWDEIKLEGVNSYFKKQYPDIEFDYGILNGNELNEDVERYIRAKKIDVLAIPTSKRNIFARMFNPSIARKMLFHTNTPIFVLRG
jgi:nucleotide-binding universal stress UspA family protein